MDVDSVIKEAIQNVVSRGATKDLEVKKYLSRGDFDEVLSKHGIGLERVFAEAAVLASRASRVIGSRSYHDSITYVTAARSEEELLYVETSSTKWAFDVNVIKNCVVSANKSIELIHDISLIYGIEFFRMLGLRNLSSFVGEIFAKEVQLSMPDKLMSNQNQDGYPDLCVLTPEGRRFIEQHRREDGTIKTDKDLWSPYPMGGVEVKATCGNTPPASRVPKPTIGESRLPIMVNAEWKAHHQETKSLLGVFWDFVDSLPTMLAVFFRNDLDTTIGEGNNDWGAIIRPIDGAGRTTSVSIMKRGRTENEGVKKMGQGWLVLPANDKLLKPICTVFSIDLRSKLI